MEPVLIGKIVGVAAYMLLECWLGKTERTKAGSVLEFFAQFLVKKEPNK